MLAVALTLVAVPDVDLDEALDLDLPEVDDDQEPTVDELEAIEAEAPFLAAELAIVDAEIALAVAEVDHDNRPSTCSARRVRRARVALARAHLIQSATRSIPGGFRS